MKLVKYIISFLTVALFLAIVVHNLASQLERTKQVQALMEENVNLKHQIEKQSAPLEAYKEQVDRLMERVTKLQSQLDKKMDLPSRGGERPAMIIMKATAYDLSVESCGKPPGDPEYGITASGKRVRGWHTIAAGKGLPFGTQVYIPLFKDMPNNGVFTVEDRGSAIDNGKIDIYMPAHEDCMEFGVQELEVYILREVAL